MNAALTFEESKKRTLVPKRVVGLAAVLLTSAAITPINLIAAESMAEVVGINGQEAIGSTFQIMQSPINLKTMEQKAGTASFSCLSVRNISLIEETKVKTLKREKIIASVLSWQGVNYRWGGRTKAGVDCSGLVERVYWEHGIQLPRSSYEQFRMGVGIPKGNLEPADLVFFNTNGAGASHVGIYLGNGQFISATKNCVEVQSLDQPYWAKTYRGSRRIID